MQRGVSAPIHAFGAQFARHDAFSRLFRMIESEPFAKALSRFALDWARMLEAAGIRQVAVDGKAEAAHLLAVYFLLLKRREQTLENAALRPAAEPGVDREPFSEPLRKRAPLAAVLQDMQNRVDDDDVRNPHVPALNRKLRVDCGAMFRRDLFHDCAPLDFYLIVDKHLSTEPSKNPSVNKP